jgi:deoxyribose-phosphate aldolase
MFDHTNLKADANQNDFETLCREARDNNCAMVAINSAHVALCKTLLADCDVRVGAAISFPLGQTTLETKKIETLDAIENGADEIDYVINIGEVKNGNYAYIEQEMSELVSLCKEKGLISKVIFENCYLTDEEIVKVAEIAKCVLPNFIKTSTGFGTHGARVEHVKLMKDTVGDAVKVKAAGEVRSWETCRAMIEAGAERIGTSSMLQILKEYDEATTKQ